MVDGRLTALTRLDERLRRGFGPARILFLRAELERAGSALDRAGSGFVRARQDALRGLESRLAALDPLAPLARGYALVRDERGRFVRSRLDVRAGDRVVVQVADGEFAAEVKP